MELKDIVVVSACRTPLGKFGGTLKNMPAYDIGVVAIREALKRANITGNDIQDVILGNCRQAGNGPNPARTAAVKGGIPVNVPVETINMACPSAMRALIHSAQEIMLGMVQVALVGGFDSMSTIPYLLKGARWEGFGFGDKKLLDGWADSVDPLCNVGMGETAENLYDKYKISRQEQDQFATESHLKAAKAQENGWFDNEIVPIEVPQKKGEPIIFSRDEGIRKDTSIEKLALLPTVFRKGGTVTPGNACQMSDGACAAVVMSRNKAQELGLKPLFSMVAYSLVAVEPSTMGDGPSISIPAALDKAGMTLKDMDFIEVNEAFAIQVLANEQVLKWDRSKLNVHGGAIALGHPTGISGLRILITLYNALKQQDKEIGIAAICGGGGVSMATIIKRED
ncbi:MAG: thiolase family protein [Candidatus Stahlbacteria bacterium]|nr:thiolase family protein [Candidatus Stahlbacteria bacterium]